MRQISNWRKDKYDGKWVDGSYSEYKLFYLSNIHGLIFRIEHINLFIVPFNNYNDTIINQTNYTKLIRKFSSHQEAKDFVDRIAKLDVIVRQRFFIRNNWVKK